ncbi:MAG TPA: MBOAT family O-acyltransferase [Rhizomicrobium sp.]|jgi:alginate O-acetyltransferase complex protein AlgI
MIFTSLPFVIFFSLLYVLLFAIRNDIARRWILLLASFFFYGYWNPWYLLLIWAVTGWSWLLGLYISAAPTPRRKKRGVAIGVTLSLLALAIFKYTGFFADNVSAVFGWRMPAFLHDIVLPVGISFYTFHSISYYVDVYRGQVAPARSLRDYALYIAFFPQLVAGPIVRASQFLPQLLRPIALTRAGFVAGIRLVLAGAVQKLLLADQVSPFVDQVYAHPALYSGATEWLAAVAYAMQIFGDFSGYTLMAIGLARILGFELPENFRMPYISASIVEFWRRWHITLSFFLRDYLYISLGGNRSGFLRTQANVFVTMVLGGLWHGASWNFVVWGFLHGTAIVWNHVWKLWPAPILGRFALWRMFRWPVCWTLTFLFVTLAWIPFRAVHFDTTLLLLQRMFTLADGVRWYHTPTLFTLAGFVLWHIAYLNNLRLNLRHCVDEYWVYATEVASLVTLLVMFAPLETSPFIYFQF